MKKNIVLLWIVTVLTSFLCSAAAAPLTLGENVAEVMIYPYEGGDGTYTYSYSYPFVAENDEASEAINLFYQDEINYAMEFRVPMDLEYNASTGMDAGTEISSEVTCNNDEYFCVLIRKHAVMDGESMETWQGNVFSRNNVKPGSCVALPYLLGILSTDNNDTWLQDRQTEKANKLVRDLIYDKMIRSSDSKDLEFYPDFSRDLLDYIFYPEEDFYLDASGEPVFFIQPGYAAEESFGLLTYPLTLEEITDEL